MVFSDYCKQRIIFFHDQGLRSTSIKKELEKEGIQASVVGVWRSRSQLGLMFRECVLSADKGSKQRKRLLWARENLTAALSDGFTDVD